jgi:CheY-like chemotaxis protein
MRQSIEIKPRVVGLEAGQPVYRILIVENQADSRQLLVELLSAVGFDVQTANNGQEAVLIWQQWHPHLIWMDMRMPIMNGREATQKIKSLPGGDETIIIALTASSFMEEREQILAEGCDDFIRKPYREDEIFDALTRHLGVRFVYESGAASQGQAIIPLDLSGFPDTWLSQLEQATLEADAHDIRELAHQVSQTYPSVAESLVRLSVNFAYDTILDAITKAKESL